MSNDFNEIFIKMNIDLKNSSQDIALIEVKQFFLDRFNELKYLENTMQFILYLHIIEFTKFELNTMIALNIDIEIKLVKFQKSFRWKNKFHNLVTEIKL